MYEFSCCLNKRGQHSLPHKEDALAQKVYVGRLVLCVTHSKNLRYDFRAALVEVLLIKQVKSAISCFVRTPWYVTAHLSSRFS